MKLKDILKAINGISTPIGGVSWNPISTDKTQAKEILTFLEDRRVLYNPSEVEIPSHCVNSILEIRKFLTVKINAVKSEEFKSVLKAMQASCRKFLDTIGGNPDIVTYGSNFGHFASWTFIGALGELRGVFGIYLAKMAVLYSLDIEGNLSSILPDPDNSDKN